MISHLISGAIIGFIIWFIFEQCQAETIKENIIGFSVHIGLGLFFGKGQPHDRD